MRGMYSSELHNEGWTKTTWTPRLQVRCHDMSQGWNRLTYAFVKIVWVYFGQQGIVKRRLFCLWWRHDCRFKTWCKSVSSCFLFSRPKWISHTAFQDRRCKGYLWQKLFSKYGQTQKWLTAQIKSCKKEYPLHQSCAWYHPPSFEGDVVQTLLKLFFSRHSMLYQAT